MRTPFLLVAMLSSVAAVGCDAIETIGIGDDFDPRNFTGQYTWVLETWNNGAPVGHPEVRLAWDLPPDFRNESFRVYSRAVSGGGYLLTATTTSCTSGRCHHVDANVQGGESYDYYIATVDERDGREIGSTSAIRVNVPGASNVPVPARPSVTSLDNAAYLTWVSVGAQRYMVLSSVESGDIFLIGETDGTSFYDDRAQNGTRVRYYVAAVDSNDRASALSPAAEAFPRPDYHSEIVYVHADSVQASGFRFVVDPVGQNPVVSGNSGNAQWRLVESGGTYRIEPLGLTQVTTGTFTTALTCGPGDELDCVDVRTAPAAGSFTGNPVIVQAGRTYVFRLPEGTGARYAKIRVQGITTNSANRRLMLFDWAYQTRINEPSLSLTPER